MRVFFATSELAPLAQSGGLGDAVAGLAGALAARVQGARTTIHERFGTAVVEWGPRIDIAERRSETYARPGALPEVRAGTAEEDLARRDFTVNAIAVMLAGAEIQAATHALEDLAAHTLRVLHERSFIDDPTRLLRLARYRARLGFDVEERTAQLARQAGEAEALATVSGARVGAELWLAAREGALAPVSELWPGPPFDSGLLDRATALLPADGDGAILALGVWFSGWRGRAEASRMMDRCEFAAEQRERVLAAAFDAGELARALERAQRPSRVHAVLLGKPPEAIAIAGAIGSDDVRRRVQAWPELRSVGLGIGGDDLLAAGVPQGPEIGRRLQRALERRLDGELAAGREAELAAALEGQA